MQIDPYTGKQVQYIRRLPAPQTDKPVWSRNQFASEEALWPLLIAAALAVVLLLVSGM